MDFLAQHKQQCLYAFDFFIFLVSVFLFSSVTFCTFKKKKNPFCEIS